MSSGSYAAGLRATIEDYQKTLNKIDLDIDSIVTMRNGNIDKPELLGIANPALLRLQDLESTLVDGLIEHRKLLNNSSNIRGIVRRVLKKLTLFKKQSGMPQITAKEQEQRIVTEFNLQSKEIMRAHQSSHQQQQSHVPTSNRASSSSMPMYQSRPYSAQRGITIASLHNYREADHQPSQTNRIYEKSSGSTSREHRGHVQAAPYTDSQQNYYSSQRRGQDINYDQESITNDPPPPYRSVRSSQRHQSVGSVSSSQWDRNSGHESIRSDVVTRGSHRSTPSGGSYDPRFGGAEPSRGARVSSDGSRFSDDYYSNEATYGSMDDPGFIPEEEEEGEGVQFDYSNPNNQGARQYRRGEYPQGPAASGNSGYHYGAHQ